METFTVDLEAVATTDGAPPAQRLIMAIEALCIAHGFRCMGIEVRKWGRDRDNMSREARGQASDQASPNGG